MVGIVCYHGTAQYIDFPKWLFISIIMHNAVWTFEKCFRSISVVLQECNDYFGSVAAPGFYLFIGMIFPERFTGIKDIVHKSVWVLFS